MVGSVFTSSALVLMASAQGLLQAAASAGGVLLGRRWPDGRGHRDVGRGARGAATVRSTVLGIVSAAGSLGALLSAPIGQS